jgi:hypothetical protein
MLNFVEIIKSSANRIDSIGSGEDIALNFELSGIEIFRNLVPKTKIVELRDAWERMSNSSSNERILRFNPVESLDLPHSLIEISRAKEVLNAIRLIFGPSVGIFKRRVVAKDGSYTGSIFLHQDTGYQRGGMNKASLFIALTDINENSGGLEFWLGTHKFGYLDDAGEINAESLPADWPRLKPILKMGDAVLMDSRLWHSSAPNSSGLPRIMTDFIYQQGSDASSLEVIDANTSEFFECSSIVRFDSPTLFVRSRVQTIRELTNKLEGN